MLAHGEKLAPVAAAGCHCHCVVPVSVDNGVDVGELLVDRGTERHTRVIWHSASASDSRFRVTGEHTERFRCRFAEMDTVRCGTKVVRSVGMSGGEEASSVVCQR